MESVAQSYWPTPSQELLLKAACLQGDTAVAAWTAWSSEHALDSTDPGSLRLLPLVYHNLKSLQYSDATMPVLRGLARDSFIKFHLLLDAVAVPLREMEATGLQPLLFKGVPLALRHYPAENLRPMADCDILVRPQDALAALEIMNRLGWANPGFANLATATSCRTADGYAIDLHQNAFFQCPYDRHDEHFWTRAEPLLVGGVATRCLSTTDQFFYVCVHGLRWDPMPPVRWVADLMMLLRDSAAIDWSLLVRMAQERRLTLPVFEALTYLHQTLNAPVPAGVLEELSQVPTSWLERRERLAWSRSPELMDGVWIKWARYRRLLLNADPAFHMSPISFFGEAWKVRHSRDLPGLLLRRTWAKLREKSEAVTMSQSK